MLLTDYYGILGLTPGASKTQIRKAYRELAKEFHPDHNKEPDAHEKFIKIREAYEVLTTGKLPSKIYTYNNPRPYPKYSRYAHRPDNQRWAEEFRKRKAAQREEEIFSEAAFKIISKVAAVVKVLIFIFSLSMLIDYFLPALTYNEIVQNKSNSITRIYTSSTSTNWLLTEKFEIPVIFDLFINLEKNKPVQIKVSPLYLIVKKINYNGYSYKPAYSIYTNFLMFPVALLISSTVILVSKFKKDDLVINVGFNLLLTGIVIYLMFN